MEALKARRSSHGTLAAVPRHLGCLLHQGEEHAPLSGIDGLCTEPNPVLQPPRVSVGGAMGTHVACPCPEHKQMLAADDLGGHDRLVGRVETIALASNPPLDVFRSGGVNAARRQDRVSVRLLDADHDIPSVEVVIVVRKGADCLQDLPADRLGVPTRLELDSLRLNTAAFQEAPDVDWKDLAHAQENPSKPSGGRGNPRTGKGIGRLSGRSTASNRARPSGPMSGNLPGVECFSLHDSTPGRHPSGAVGVVALTQPGRPEPAHPAGSRACIGCGFLRCRALAQLVSMRPPTAPSLDACILTRQVPDGAVPDKGYTFRSVQPQ